MIKTKMAATATVLILLFTLCVNTYAVQGINTEDEFVYDKETNEIIAYNGASSDVTIPENATVSNKFKFSSRGLQTNSSNEFVKVKKFVVSKGVTIKGDLNLGSYDGFAEVEFNNSAADMPNVDFYFSGDEKLKKLILPNGLTEIRNSMCYGCTALEEVHIPDSVSVIGQNAFENCKSIKELILPKRLVQVGDKAFDGCNAIRKIYVPSKVGYTNLYVPYQLESAEFETEPQYTTDFFNTFLKTKWFENDVIPSLKDDLLMADGTLFKYIGKDKTVTVPDGIEVIGKEAFANTAVESVTLPDTLKEIMVNAFWNCKNLKKITIPKSVTMVKSSAFGQCYGLEELVIDGSPVMEDNVFEFCNLLTDEKITINGEIQYVVSVSGEKSIPFAFTNTSFNEGIWGDTVINPAPSPTANPASTPNPTTTPAPTDTTEPTAAPAPTASPDSADNENILAVTGSDEVTIEVNGSRVDFADAKPFVDENGRTQVPVRAVAEMLKAEVDWNDEIKTATVTNGNGTVIITVGSDIMTVSGEQVKMDTAAMIKDSRTFIPVRFVAEALGLIVEWN